MTLAKKRFKLFPNKKDVDMTEGSIIRHLIMFAIPLLIGNAFQQFYNTVDAWVVGKHVSNEAFSAVGSLGPIINTFVGFFSGFASGAGVVISQYYGAGDKEKVKHAVHTAIVSTALLGILFTILGSAVIPIMLDFTKTPDEVRPDAYAYLSIYFAGILGLMIYNIGAGILRAVGDSTRPFWFLVVSAVINVGLDLLFVIGFELGVKGVGYATIIAQGVSAILVILTLMFSKNCIKLYIKELKIDFEILKKIMKIGLPAALQLAITSFSNVFVQSYVNQFGPEFMGGWTAYSKIDAYALLPMQALSLSITTFVGQNLGKNNVQRARKGTTIALWLSVAMTAAISLPIIIFAPQLVHFLNESGSELVIDYGTMIIRWLSPFYVLCCANQIYAGSLRGAGNSKAPMAFSLISFVLFRRVYLYIMATFISNTHIPIAMAYPAGWLLCSLMYYIYYKNVKLEKSRVVED